MKKDSIMEIDDFVGIDGFSFLRSHGHIASGLIFLLYVHSLPVSKSFPNLCGILQNFCEFECSASQWFKATASIKSPSGVRSGTLTVLLVCWAYAGQGSFRTIIPASAESPLKIGVCHFGKWKHLGCVSVPWTRTLTGEVCSPGSWTRPRRASSFCCFLTTFGLLPFTDCLFVTMWGFPTCSLSYRFVDGSFQQLLRRMSIWIINWLCSFSLI